MGDPRPAEVLAVDGGGSGSRLALLRGGQRIEVQSGPANASTDMGGTVGSLRAGLDALASAAGLCVSDLADIPAFLGLAGIVGPTDAVQVAHGLPLNRARIESDQASTAEGALGARDGAVAGLGTGSFFGVRTGSKLQLAGGWGHRIDDRASGFWLGREALRTALMVEDGRQPPGWVSGAVMSRFGSAHAIVRFARDAGPEEMAGLAPLVVDGADRDDPAAQAILAQGAAHVVASLIGIGWDSTLAICPIGGVAPAFAPYLARHGTLIEPAGSPLDGAVSRALRFAAGEI